MKPSLLAIFLTFLHFSSTPTNSSKPIPRNTNTNTDFIKTLCNNTTLYPKLCYRTLSTYANQIKTDPRLLANIALNTTVKSAQSTARLVSKVAELHGLKPIEVSAVGDCVSLVADSVDELKNSMEEMEHHPEEKSVGMVISDIQTWVSAALTDDDTCLDSIEEADTKNAQLRIVVRKHIWRVAHMTSNALALFDWYASTLVK